MLRGSTDITIGNAVGSTVFNVFFIVGAGSLSRPLGFDARAGGGNVDVAAAALGSFLLFPALCTARRRRLERWEGLLFLVLYAGYVWLRYTLDGA